jgi:hypothetical protein
MGSLSLVLSALSFQSLRSGLFKVLVVSTVGVDALGVEIENVSGNDIEEVAVCKGISCENFSKVKCWVLTVRHNEQRRRPVA